MTLPGVAVVLSPLIALQHDQAEAINGRTNGTRAHLINSGMSKSERDAAWESAADDNESTRAKFLFLAPSRWHATTSPRGSDPSTSPSWSSMKRTASHPGDMTSAPTTSSWVTSSGNSVRPSSPSPRLPASPAPARARPDRWP